MNIFEKLFGNEKSFKDGVGQIAPKLGYVTFLYEEYEKPVEEINPDCVRIAITQAETREDVVTRIKWYHSKNILVILNLQHKYEPMKTAEMADYYARHIDNSKIIYEFWNEPNLEYQIALKEGWHNYLAPEEYCRYFMQFRSALKKVDSNIKIAMGGLAGDINKNKSNQMDAVQYRSHLVQLGITTLLNYWDYHCYKFKHFYRNLEHCRMLAPDKPIIIGEFGSDNMDERTKIQKYKQFVDKFTKNSIDIAIVYAWDGGFDNRFALKTRPEFRKIVKTYRRRIK